MKKLLSVLIPTYNMSLYIERCMNSLLSEKTKEKLDIIVINDGSKDDSSEKAKKIALLYPNSIRVIDKENGNYGSCINAGLKLAKGKYIKILDADDQFDTKNLERILEEIENKEADLVLTDFLINEEQGKSELINFSIDPFKLLPFSEICSSKDFKRLWMHSVMYKTSIFKNINYHQTEGISYTDQEWIFAPLSVVKNVFYIPSSLYIYTLGREGQTVSTPFLEKNFAHHVICLKSMFLSFNNLPKDTPEPIKQMLYSRLLRFTKFVYKGFLIKKYQDPNNTLKDFDEFIRTSNPTMYEDIKKVRLSKPIIPYHYIKHWQKSPNSKVLYYMIKLYIWKKRIF